jgi:hypothetical protein
MQNNEWITMLRQIPTELHQQTVLVLNNKMEITVEMVLRLDQTFTAVRGRLSGTTDGGLLFLVPYDQLTAVYMFKQMTEDEVDKMFGAVKATSRLGTTSAQALRVGSAIPGTPGSSLGSKPAPAPLPAAATGASAPAPGTMPSFGRPPESTAVARNNLLERLRAARQAAAPQQPNGSK